MLSTVLWPITTAPFMALLCGVLCVMKTDFLRSISPVTGCQKLGKVMDEMMRESSYVRVVRFVLY